MSAADRDLHFAIRTLSKQPVLTAALVISLALGVGLNTAIFGLVHTLLLAPPPGMSDATALVALFATVQEGPSPLGGMSYPDYVEYEREAGVFTGLAAHAPDEFTLSHDGPSERISGMTVTNDFFGVLGVRAAAGQLTWGDDSVGAPSAVIGHSLWQSRYAGDPEVIGRTITVNGRHLRVHGVAARGFKGIDMVQSADLFLPLETYFEIGVGPGAAVRGVDRGLRWLYPVGRLAEGTGMEQARRSLQVMARHLEQTHPDTNQGVGVDLLPLAEIAFGIGNRQRVARYTALLAAVAGAVLLIACCNVAGLQLTRTFARSRETALRCALGASRSRLLRMIMAESFLVAAMGGLAGIGLACVSLPLLERLALPADVTYELAAKPAMLIFGFAASLLSGAAIALLPIMRGLRPRLAPALHGHEWSRTRRKMPARDLLIVIQVALALVVTVLAGLFMRTLHNLQEVDLGYDPERVLSATLDLSPRGLEGVQLSDFYAELYARLRRTPGVEDVGLASALPMVGARMEVLLSLDIEGREPPTGEEDPPSARHAMVGGKFFDTVGLELLNGRVFNDQDSAGASPTVVVNQTMARRYWPGQDPVGHRVHLVHSPEPFTVIGVVADSSYTSLRELPEPILYLWLPQHRASFIGNLLAPIMTILVRSEGVEPLLLAPALRRAVQTADPSLPVFHVTTLAGNRSAAMRIESQATWLLGIHAALAVFLSMVGLYGLLANASLRRRHEMAVRVALGATPRSVVALLSARGIGLGLTGITLGLFAALVVSRVITSHLFGVSPHDPATYVAISCALALSIGALSFAPARAGARVEPATLLRSV